MCDHPGSPSQCGQAPFGSLLGFSGQHGEGGPVHIRSGMEIPTAHEPLFHCPVTCVGREIVLLLRQLKWILKGESSPALFWETILAVLVPWALRETVGIPRNFTHRRCPSCIHLEHSIALARL